MRREQPASNINRLRAAIGAKQDDPPSDLDALIQKHTQSNGGEKGGDDDHEAHLAADIATALTGNALRGMNPRTYSVTVIYWNFDVLKLGKGKNEVAFGHEPSVTVVLSPDPNSQAAYQAAYQAAIGLVNLHMKRYWGLVKPDIEISISGQTGVQTPGAAPSGGLQRQVEVHGTTKISVTLGASLGVRPQARAGDPPDRGAFHFGNRNIDMSFTPFSIGIFGRIRRNGSRRG